MADFPSDERLHELAQPIGKAKLEHVEPVLRGMAYDDTITVEEMCLTVIYSDCQSIASMLEAIPHEDRAETKRFIREWIKL